MKENLIGYYESIIDIDDYEKIDELLQQAR